MLFEILIRFLSAPAHFGGIPKRLKIFHPTTHVCTPVTDCIRIESGNSNDDEIIALLPTNEEGFTYYTIHRGDRHKYVVVNYISNFHPDKRAAELYRPGFFYSIMKLSLLTSLPARDTQQKQKLSTLTV